MSTVSRHKYLLDFIPPCREILLIHGPSIGLQPFEYWCQLAERLSDYALSYNRREVASYLLVQVLATRAYHGKVSFAHIQRQLTPLYVSKYLQLLGPDVVIPAQYVRTSMMPLA